jgi:hypothetical protein
MPRRTGRLPQYRSLLGYLLTHALLLVLHYRDRHHLGPESLGLDFLLIHIHVFFCLLARENMRPPTVRLP